jgi:hypothetical protein
MDKRNGNGTLYVLEGKQLRKVYHGSWKNDLREVR